jgi:hypothetical protein
LIATAPVPQGEDTTFKLKVYDYLAPNGIVEAQFSINKSSPVSVILPADDEPEVVDVNKEVVIDFNKYVTVSDESIRSGLKYKLSFSLKRNGQTVSFGPATYFNQDGLSFSNGVLKGKLNLSYPGQIFSFDLDVDYSYKGETCTFETKNATGDEVGIPAIVENNKKPEINHNHAFVIDAQDGINIDETMVRYPVNLSGLYIDPEGKPVTYRLLPDYKSGVESPSQLANHLEIIHLADGRAFLQVRNYLADPDIGVSLPHLFGEHKFKISADDGYNEARPDAPGSADNDFKFVINLSKNKAPVLINPSATDTVVLKLAEVVA